MNVRTFIIVVIALAVWLGSPTHAVAKDVEFSATIGEIITTKQFDKKTIVSGADPRFFVKMTLDQDVDGIGKHGDSVGFAVHSLARDLMISDQKAAVGRRMNWVVGRKDESDILYLRRAGTNKPQRAVPSGGGTPSN